MKMLAVFAAALFLHAPVNVRAMAPNEAMPQQEKPKGKKKEKRDGDEQGVADAKPAKAARTPAEDSARASKRAERAEKLPLFTQTTQLPFTLIADFGRINKDRDSLSTKRYPATLVVTDDKGAERRIPVGIRTRGHYRLQKRTCSFVNMLVIFPDSGMKGTPFHGERSLKLGAHCQGDSRYEMNLMKEYLAYRIFNLVTPKSFRARLSLGTYVDSASGKVLDKKTAMWIENEDDVAARNLARIREARGAIFDDLEPRTLDLLTLFEYAIGNTDYSIYALHNTRLAQGLDGAMYVLGYDFDFSGLVGAPYSIPDPQLNIKSVRQRLYRGPCRTLDEFAPAVSRFNAQKDSILGLFSETPELKGGELKDVRGYLDEFFETLSKPKSIKGDIMDSCVSKAGI